MTILPDYAVPTIVNNVSEACDRIAARVIDAASAYDLPHVVMRPTLSIDGNQWCALYGENLQDGVAGFGDSPAAAMHAFDLAWHAPLRTPEPPPCP